MCRIQFILHLQEMFSACDLDHDGSVSLEELMVIIAASLDEETGTDIDLIEDILQAIDKDGNGERRERGERVKMRSRGRRGREKSARIRSNRSGNL